MPNDNGQLKLTVDPTEAQLGLQAMMGNQSLPEVVNQAAQQGIFGPPGQLMADAQVPAPPQDQAAAQGGGDQPAFDPNKGAIVANVTGMAPLTGTPQYGSQTQSALPPVPSPAATGTAVPSAQPWRPPTAGPTTEQTLTAAAQPFGTSESALGAIPTAPQPTAAGAVQPTRGQRFLHGLGQVLGTALGAVSPGVAMQIPGTPLGKIAAANRAMQQQRLQTEAVMAGAQAQKAQIEAQTAGPLAQAQIDDYESRGLLTREQAANLRDKTNVVLPNGMILPMTAAEAEKYYQNRETVAGRLQGVQITATAREDAANIMAGKPTRPMTGTVNGKPTYAYYRPGQGFFDPETNQPVPGFQPPPNWTQSVMAVPGFDPNTLLPTVYEVPRGGGPATQATIAPAPGAPVGTPAQPIVSPSGAAGHEMFQAGAIQRAAPPLIQAIKDNKKLMGNTTAMINSILMGTPWADPKTAELYSQLAGYIALQPSMHGLRGQAAMEEFRKVFGSIPNNPDALIAAIEGNLKTTGAIQPLGAAKTGAAPITRTYQGQIYQLKPGGNPKRREDWTVQTPRGQ